MQICKIVPENLRPALELIWEVFEEFEVPDYEEMGIQTFRHFIEYHNMVEKVNQGEMTFWGCYIGRLLVGVLALRSGQHISLLFVRDKFHHLGVATSLMQVAVSYVLEGKPKIPAVTVNSSPYAVGFYEAMGFEALGPERRENGIKFTSMRRRL